MQTRQENQSEVNKAAGYSSAIHSQEKLPARCSHNSGRLSRPITLSSAAIFLVVLLYIPLVALMIIQAERWLRLHPELVPAKFASQQQLVIVWLSLISAFAFLRGLYALCIQWESRVSTASSK